MHLLAGQGGVAVGAEIYRRFFLVSQVVLKKLYKEPLSPAVVLRFSRDGLAAPVEHGTHGFELAAHILDIMKCPFLGVDAPLDGGVLRRQAKGVKAHREQDIVALHAFETSAGVGWGHSVPVTDMQVSGGVGQHGQGIKFGLFNIDIGMVDAVIFPAFLPFGFDFFRFIHGYTCRVRHVLLQ